MINQQNFGYLISRQIHFTDLYSFYIFGSHWWNDARLPALPGQRFQWQNAGSASLHWFGYLWSTQAVKPMITADNLLCHLRFCLLFVECQEVLWTCPSPELASWVMMAWSYVPRNGLKLLSKCLQVALHKVVRALWGAGTLESRESFQTSSIQSSFNSTRIFVLVSRWVLLRTTTQMRPNHIFSTLPTDQSTSSKVQGQGI